MTVQDEYILECSNNIYKAQLIRYSLNDSRRDASTVMNDLIVEKIKWPSAVTAGWTLRPGFDPVKDRDFNLRHLFHTIFVA